MQKHYVHRIPKSKAGCGPRVNLTWRWIKCHGRGCPLRVPGAQPEEEAAERPSKRQRQDPPAPAQARPPPAPRPPRPAPEGPPRVLSAADADLPAECLHGTPFKRWPKVLERGYGTDKKGFVHFSTDGLSQPSAEPATGLGVNSTSARQPGRLLRPAAGPPRWDGGGHSKGSILRIRSPLICRDLQLRCFCCLAYLIFISGPGNKKIDNRCDWEFPIDAIGNSVHVTDTE